VYEQLKTHGRVRRGTIGVLVQSITPVLAEALQLPQDSGAFVADVDADGPAAKAGLRIGDIVVALDGKPIENGRQLDVNLYRRTAGAVATLDVVRGKETLRLPVAVDERGGKPLRFATLVTREQHLVARLGVLAISLDDRLRGELALARATPALVAARAGRKPSNTASSPGTSSWP
jgi:serine protease Do